MSINQIFTSIDLELNKENDNTTDIIQIGAVIGNVITGEVLEELRLYVNIDKPLSPYITTLTGITENDLKTKGTSLLTAYEALKHYHNKHKAHTMCVQWGGGDEKCLKDQLIAKGMTQSDWIFGRTSYNVKTLVQSILLSKEQSTQGGLKKNCNRFQVNFQGPAHDALNDAKATFKLFNKLLKDFSAKL